ncbi:hypothetical protein Tco_0695348 [Tanacetum coccineum]
MIGSKLNIAIHKHKQFHGFKHFEWQAVCLGNNIIYPKVLEDYPKDLWVNTLTVCITFDSRIEGAEFEGTGLDKAFVLSTLRRTEDFGIGCFGSLLLPLEQSADVAEDKQHPVSLDLLCSCWHNDPILDSFLVGSETVLRDSALVVSGSSWLNQVVGQS